MSTLDRVNEKIVHAKGLFGNNLEIAIVKATKRNSKAPKWKHVSILLNATWRRDISISDIGMLLAQRLQDSSWSVVFKSLIVTHILMEQGSNDRLIGFLATQPNILNVAGFRDASGSRVEQAKNIQRYAAYLEEKVHVYREIKKDYCRPASPNTTLPTIMDPYGSNMNYTSSSSSSSEASKAMRIAHINDDFLRDLSALLRQLLVLLKSHFLLQEIDNPVTLTAFKLLVIDLLKLYQLMNEGLINVLQHLKTLPKPLAQKGIQVFRSFVQSTSLIDRFLATAKEIPIQTFQISIPQLTYIPDIADNLEKELESSQPFASPTSLSSPNSSSSSSSSTSSSMEPTTIKPFPSNAYSVPPPSSFSSIGSSAQAPLMTTMPLTSTLTPSSFAMGTSSAGSLSTPMHLLNPNQPSMTTSTLMTTTTHPSSKSNTLLDLFDPLTNGASSAPPPASSSSVPMNNPSAVTSMGFQRNGTAFPFSTPSSSSSTSYAFQHVQQLSNPSSITTSQPRPLSLPPTIYFSSPPVPTSTMSPPSIPWANTMGRTEHSSPPSTLGPAFTTSNSFHPPPPSSSSSSSSGPTSTFPSLVNNPTSAPLVSSSNQFSTLPTSYLSTNPFAPPTTQVTTATTNYYTTSSSSSSSSSNSSILPSNPFSSISNTMTNHFSSFPTSATSTTVVTGSTYSASTSNSPSQPSVPSTSSTSSSSSSSTMTNTNPFAVPSVNIIAPPPPSSASLLY